MISGSQCWYLKSPKQTRPYSKRVSHPYFDSSAPHIRTQPRQRFGLWNKANLIIISDAVYTGCGTARQIIDSKLLPRRAVVLESGLETFFYRLGLVLDSLVFGLGLDLDLVIGLAKCSGLDRVQLYMLFFFSFKTKPLIWLACSENG